MKIVYYVSDHGLGHSSRTVAIVRELQKKKVDIIIRNNNLSFFQKSLPKTTIVTGQTDFVPIMNRKNGMRVDVNKTRKSISDWTSNLSQTIKKESSFIKKQKPDLVITDISIMPILAAKENNVKSVAISNFVWSDTLEMNKREKEFVVNTYSQANLILKLPFGSPMKFPNRKEVGLVARKITESRKIIRQQLGLSTYQKLVLIALSGFKEKKQFYKSDNIVVLDISDYSSVLGSRKKVNFVEGQNLINASDLVICKCGYGFISECLGTGVKFRYLLEPEHKEAVTIHKSLVNLGLQNMIKSKDLKKLKLDNNYIKESESFLAKNHNIEIVNKILSVAQSAVS